MGSPIKYGSILAAVCLKMRGNLESVTDGRQSVLEWRHNERHGNSNHRRSDSGADQAKYQSFASMTFVRGICWWPMDSLHKGTVTPKMFLFDDLIMVQPIIPMFITTLLAVGNNTALSMESYFRSLPFIIITIVLEKFGLCCNLMHATKLWAA